MKRVLQGRGQRWIAAFLMGLILALVTAEVSRAQEPPSTAPIIGYDISWPQCDGPYPGNRGSIAIIGVNGGRPYTGNRCLESEWRWAKDNADRTAVYINLDYPRQLSIQQFFGAAGFCPPHDIHCQAYNWGWNGARDSVQRARAAGVDTREYWLDVETMNHWSPDVTLNEMVITGAIHYLERLDLRVGIYSTPYQWGVIAGGYAPGKPVWTAGARHFFDAVDRCNNPRYAFGGGPVELVQWVEVYDMNIICR